MSARSGLSQTLLVSTAAITIVAGRSREPGRYERLADVQVR
jgi:hypothetical protein